MTLLTRKAIRHSAGVSRVGGASFSAKRAIPAIVRGLLPYGGQRLTYLTVQLKVCEGCGGLRFRTQNRVDIYCSSCAQKLAEFPRMVRKRRGRPCKQRVQTVSADGGVQ